MDIVERLRQRKFFFQNGGIWLMGSGPDDECQEAADEIDRLRSLLRGAQATAELIARGISNGMSE